MSEVEVAPQQFRADPPIVEYALAHLAGDRGGRKDRVARALSSLGVPTKKDIDKLSKRVAELTAVVQQLTDTQSGTAKKVAKPVAKAAAKVAAVPAAAKTVARKAAPAKKPAPTKSVAAKKPAEPVNAPAGAATVA